MRTTAFIQEFGGLQHRRENFFVSSCSCLIISSGMTFESLFLFADLSELLQGDKTCKIAVHTNPRFETTETIHEFGVFSADIITKRST